MKKILLACSAGMSTSLLVSRMEEEAKARGIDAEIWAVTQDHVPSEMERADVLLIGPQMHFLKDKFSEIAEELKIPLDVIDHMAYGRVDGKAVLNQALELLSA
ncbi:Oligo-beta-mannoside-specific phosphotransferase enzyme IIB component [Paraliobacillus sp. PM-2]|uniref:PTS sugar transporter subunit IIB n=1 Tax=Paraliobacillus sp. PM-2 TaxID=1462524 RepID=UPI00061C1675|nr:PTS sugar transporter subunit IIB [Paraliobacillus sp. PM-2]CQR46021.1 Oligo-beta-mannoside-specific phosphotransferase enzyme IIB component [Paraliobacillus sp. PM-2]